MSALAEKIAEALHDEWDGACSNPCPRYAEGTAIVDRILSEQWISVKEKLPEPSREGKTVSNLVLAWAGQHVVSFYSNVLGWDEDDVTHWMPLPDPPRSEP